MRRSVLVSVFLVVAAAPVHAEPTQPDAKACASSFPKRHAQAKAAIAAFVAYRAEWRKGMPWFHEHCRILTEIERAIRKIDDPNAFVCDTKKGRWSGLTTAYVVAHAMDPQIMLEIDQLDESAGTSYRSEDGQCASSDPVSLAFDGMGGDDSSEHVLAVLCYGVPADNKLCHPDP